MEKEQEKWAIFWCELLTPVIYEEIEPELTNQFLKKLAKTKRSPTDGLVSRRYPPCAANSTVTARADLTLWPVKAETIVANPATLPVKSLKKPLS